MVLLYHLHNNFPSIITVKIATFTVKMASVRIHIMEMMRYR